MIITVNEVKQDAYTLDVKWGKRGRKPEFIKGLDFLHKGKVFRTKNDAESVANLIGSCVVEYEAFKAK